MSDRCSRNEAKDTAGPAVARRAEGKELRAHIYAAEILPDDRAVIERPAAALLRRTFH